MKEYNEYENKNVERIVNEQYGVDVCIFIKKWLNDDGTFNKRYVRFVLPDKEYKLTEYFKDNGTDFVTLGEEKFKRYLDAELKVIDLLRSE
jgi:hypothetical protein